MRNKKKFYIISILCQCRRDLDTDRSFESAYIRNKNQESFHEISFHQWRVRSINIINYSYFNHWISLWEQKREDSSFSKISRTKIREWQNFKSFDTNEIFPFLSPNTFQTRIKLKFINLRIIYKFRLQARVNFRSTHYRKLCAHILQKYFLKSTSSEVWW